MLRLILLLGVVVMGVGVGGGGPGIGIGGETGVTVGGLPYGGSNVGNFSGTALSGNEGFGQGANIPPHMGGQNFAQGSTDAFVNAMTQASQSHGQPPPTAEAPSGQLVSQYIGNVPSLGEQGLGGLSDLGAVNWGALLGKGLPGLGGLVGSLLGGPFGGIVGGLGANALAGLLAGKGLEGGIAQGGLGLPAAFASQAGSGIGSAFGPFGALAGSLLAGNLIGEAVAQGMAGNLGEAIPSGNEGADFSLPAFEPGAPIVMSPEVMDAVGQMASMEPRAAEAIQPPPQYSLSPTPFGWYGMKRVGLPWKSQEPGFGGNYGGMKRVNE